MDAADPWELIEERGRLDRRAERDRWDDLGARLADLLAGDRVQLRALTLDDPDEVLDQVVAGEGVHPFAGPDDLARRLAADRTILALVTPAVPDRLLGFVEVAFTEGPAASIPALLHDPVRDPGAADTATFYSINTPHRGLGGLGTGRTLLEAALPHLDTTRDTRRFVTLSPMPGFRRWVESRADADPSPERLTTHAEAYLTTVGDGGRVADPVGNFHLANGALVDRLCVGGDPSPAGVERSFGLMVNYRYEPARLDERAVAYGRGEVAARRPLPVVTA